MSEPVTGPFDDLILAKQFLTWLAQNKTEIEGALYLFREALDKTSALIATMPVKE